MELKKRPIGKKVKCSLVLLCKSQDNKFHPWDGKVNWTSRMIISRSWGSFHWNTNLWWYQKRRITHSWLSLIIVHINWFARLFILKGKYLCFSFQLNATVKDLLRFNLITKSEYSQSTAISPRSSQPFI